LSSFEERGDPFIEIRIYLTEALNTDTIRNVMINDDMLEDAVTRLRSQTNYGRPNWDKEFVDISKKHKGAKVGVFYCGNKTLATVLHNSCNQFSGTNGVKFSYTKETIV
jgi:NADPH oxidase